MEEEREWELGVQSEGEAGEEDKDLKEKDMEGENNNQEEEEQKAKGRVKEKGRKKRGHFAEDEERCENSSKDVDTTDQSLFENAGKYILAHVRLSEETVDAQKKEILERLKKQVKCLINRSSDRTWPP